MRLSQPPTLLSLLFTILSSTHTFAAPQNAREKELFQRQYHYLSERSCAGTVCGWSGQLCCTSGQACSTNSAGQAQCIASSNSGPQQANAQNGEWQYYTTTFVETDLLTRVSTYSSFFGAGTTTSAVAPAVSAISCDSSMTESPCGTICCAVGQYCVYAGQCAASDGNGAGSSSLFNVVAPTNTATAFIRPTSNVITTTTSTGSMTTTVPFISATASPTGTGASSAAGMTSTTANNGLSGGAIAGIVIGVILAVIFLFLICAYLIFKGLIDGVLGFFGLRNKRRREETYIEERHSHHASGGGGGRTWFGTRPSGVDRPKKKSSGIGGFTGVAAALGALAIILGLKRRRDDKRAKTEYSESDYTYSDTYSSQSSESSDRRERNTRRPSRVR